MGSLDKEVRSPFLCLQFRETVTRGNGFVFGDCSSREQPKDKITKKDVLLTAGQGSSEVGTSAFLD